MSTSENDSTQSIPPVESIPTDTSANSTHAYGAEMYVPPISLTIAGRYELSHEIGRGAMGVVYRARDRALDRDVAVKFLREQFVGTNLAERFMDEARITGQLQHPGIPPVFEVGALDDGRPWLAMKLINGRSLAQRLAARESFDRLSIFEQIAQAVGFAHAHGVIHRDLKPSNIMIGAFGEVQVMDWGLAKVMRTSNETDSLMVMSAAHSQLDETTMGSIKGTPTYMAPEQALGAIDQINERSDVFGLGGLLCALLTGQPTFVGQDAESTRQMAASASLDDAFARIGASGAEPELIALCKKCLAPQAADRFPNGSAVAAAVALLRSDADERARLAEVQRGQADVRRRLQLWLGSAVAATFLLGAGIATWQASEARGQARLANAKALEANQARDRARENYILAFDAFNSMVFNTQSKLENVPATQALRKSLLETAKVGLKKLLVETENDQTPDSTLVWAHFQLGDLELQLGNTSQAIDEYDIGSKIAQKLVDTDATNTRSQRDLSVSFERLGDVSLRINKSSDAREHYERSRAIRQKLVDADAANVQALRDLSISLSKLGGVSLRINKTDEALDYYKASFAIDQKLAADEPNNSQAQRDLAVSFEKLGDVSLRLNKTTDAHDYYQKSYDKHRKFANDDPSNPQAQRDLSIIINKLGDLALLLNNIDDAIIYYQEALDVRQKLSKHDPANMQAERDVSNSFNKLGDVSLRFNKPDDARDYYKKALASTLKLATDDPANSQAKRDLSVSYEKLGDVALKTRNVDEALDYYRKALVARQKLADADPANSQAHRDLFINMSKLGNVAFQSKKYDDALDYYLKTNRIVQKLSDADPTNGAAKRDVAISCIKLGDTQMALKQYAAAIVSYQKMIDLVNQQSDPKAMNLNTDYPKQQIEACRQALMQ